MSALDCRATHLSLIQPPSADLGAFVFAQDVIFVGGGNTRSLLALWREWGLDAILREAYERGIVLGGVSADMICWFEFGVTDSVPGALTPLKCLGWLPGSACPHYDKEIERRPSFQRLIAEGAIPGGYAADDGVSAPKRTFSDPMRKANIQTIAPTATVGSLADNRPVTIVIWTISAAALSLVRQRPMTAHCYDFMQCPVMVVGELRTTRVHCMSDLRRQRTH